MSDATSESMTLAGQELAHDSHAQYWVGTSWKMNKTISESISYLENLDLSNVCSAISPFILPPTTALQSLAIHPRRSSRIVLGAQNAEWRAEGAVTGEVSMRMVQDAGAQIVEIGHSERRDYFGETDLDVCLKVSSAVDNGLIPLICVGESQETRSGGKHVAYVRNQVEQALSRVEHQSLERVLVAYEPVWAIGESGRRPAIHEIEEVLEEISSYLSSLPVDSKVQLLYGGSVDADNAAQLLSIESVKGLFIGRSAWHPDGFMRILELSSQFVEEQISKEENERVSFPKHSKALSI